MPVYISFLRAINVGGRNQIRMETLRGLYAGLGFTNIRTLLQSGNVLFETKHCSSESLSIRIRAEIEVAAGFRSEVILRTARELRHTMARNPFAGRSGLDPSRLLLVLLATSPVDEAVSRVKRIDTAPDEVVVTGPEFYMYFEGGLARPKVSWNVIEKALKVPGTGRNWNTVTKLAQMAAEMELA